MRGEEVKEMKMVDFDVAEHQYRRTTKVDEYIARLHFPQKYVLLEAFGEIYSLEIQDVTDTAFFLKLTDDAIKHYTRVEKKIMNETKKLKKENEKLKKENEELKKENYKLHKRLGDFEPFEKYIKERTSKILSVNDIIKTDEPTNSVELKKELYK